MTQCVKVQGSQRWNIGFANRLHELENLKAQRKRLKVETLEKIK
jgi:hypothetical protein